MWVVWRAAPFGCSVVKPKTNAPDDRAKPSTEQFSSYGKQVLSRYPYHEQRTAGFQDSMLGKSVVFAWASRAGLHNTEGSAGAQTTP
jgi:hypothetical protein